ncbi:MULTISPECIES: hypothetical protein [unclassified Thioalkalivibrio]|uniref:hypothetical protein n=1 Tax=unclassified Thioalkalivibrio TaxID=2621013 RepID=UPI0012DC7EA5|nr:MULTISPECIES: hypothetical protein [unclassified Thioalkalivibrio]
MSSHHAPDVCPVPRRKTLVHHEAHEGTKKGQVKDDLQEDKKTGRMIGFETGYTSASHGQAMTTPYSSLPKNPSDLPIFL